MILTLWYIQSTIVTVSARDMDSGGGQWKNSNTDTTRLGPTS